MSQSRVNKIVFGEKNPKNCLFFSRGHKDGGRSEGQGGEVKEAGERVTGRAAGRGTQEPRSGRGATVVDAGRAKPGEDTQETHRTGKCTKNDLEKDVMYISIYNDKLVFVLYEYNTTLLLSKAGCVMACLWDIAHKKIPCHSLMKRVG